MPHQAERFHQRHPGWAPTWCSLCKGLLLPPFSAPHPHIGSQVLVLWENRKTSHPCGNLPGEFEGGNRVPYPLRTPLLCSEPVGKAEGKSGGPSLLIPQLSRVAPSSSHSQLLDSLCLSGFPTHLPIPPFTASVKATIQSHWLRSKETGLMSQLLTQRDAVPCSILCFRSLASGMLTDSPPSISTMEPYPDHQTCVRERK